MSYKVAANAVVPDPAQRKCPVCKQPLVLPPLTGPKDRIIADAATGELHIEVETDHRCRFLAGQKLFLRDRLETRV